jgi:hypothetical protein
MEVRQMRRKQFTQEKVNRVLRQGEVQLVQGKRVGEVSRTQGRLRRELIRQAQRIRQPETRTGCLPISQAAPPVWSNSLWELLRPSNDSLFSISAYR